MPLGYPIGTERRASPSPSRNTHQAATPSWSPGALQPKGKTCHNAVPGQKDQQKSLLLPPAAARLTGRVPAWFLADQEPQQKVIAKGVQPLVQNITDWELCLDAKGLRSAGAGPLLSVTALRIPWPRRKYCVTEEGKKQNKTKHIFFYVSPADDSLGSARGKPSRSLPLRTPDSQASSWHLYRCPPWQREGEQSGSPWGWSLRVPAPQHNAGRERLWQSGGSERKQKGNASKAASAAIFGARQLF